MIRINFSELNEELKSLVKTELPDLLLMSRIMSTLPSEYFEFKSVWESIPLAERTVNKLTERLRLIEMRLPERRSDSSALMKDKKNADKSDKRPERKEQRKCFKCHKVGHLGKNCYKKYGNARNLQKAPKPAGEAFLCERDDRQDDQWLADSGPSAHMTNNKSFFLDRQDDQWLADSGPSAHMTNNKSFFLSYEPFNYSREVQVGNNVIIHAYGEGTINVKLGIHGL
ncbi:hypothetical protein QE152_g339 [Popillia japonica]|uniref:CCHC-type domain-containing protein n=1 Tax=Popillia japonica TaxID=7064 RepID=A0AAW1NBQ9_POPJA